MADMIVRFLNTGNVKRDFGKDVMGCKAFGLAFHRRDLGLFT